MKNFDQTCREIKWTQLSSQKQTLLKMRETMSRGKDKDNLNAIIQLIDKLQDAAIDVHNVPESLVFPSLNLVRKQSTNRYGNLKNTVARTAHNLF